MGWKIVKFGAKMLKLENIIDEKDVVSFDLFDTLVYRAVSNPDDVLLMVEERLRQETGKIIDSFIIHRRQAEYKLYKKNNCFDIYDIYSNINVLDDNTKQNLAKIEIELEKAICFPSYKGFQLYDYCIKHKKRVCITSDMYLPTITIREILQKCGYFEIEDILISSNVGLWKAKRGQLFEKLISIAHTDKKRILHIGDNFKNDVVYGRLKGIKTCHYQDDRTSTYGDAKLHTENKYFNYGYNYFGPLTLGYVTWIHSVCKHQNVKHIYFFSREGKLYQRVYQCLFADDIPSTYLYVSRKALKTPLIMECTSMQELLSLFPANETVTIDDYLGVLGIAQLKETLKREAIEVHDRVRNHVDDGHLFEILMNEIVGISRTQKRNIEKYLKAEISNEDNIAIVDLGWTGSMQQAFERLLANFQYTGHVIGFYVAHMPEMIMRITQGLDSRAYCVQSTEQKYGNIMKSGAALLETVYSANHGTTLGYSEDGAPILRDEVLSDDSIKKLLDMQDGIMHYVKKNGQVQLKYNYLKADTVKKKLIAYLKNPSIPTIEMLKDIEVLDVGITKLVDYSKHPSIKIRTILHELKNSAWKLAYIKMVIRWNKTYFLYKIIRILFKKFYLMKYKIVKPLTK